MGVHTPCAFRLQFKYWVWGKLNCNKHISRFSSGPAPRGGAFRGRAPSNDCLCPPKRKLRPPKRGLCPEEINRLGAIGKQIEAWDFQIGVYRSYFRNFWELTPDFIALLGWRPSFFWFSPCSFDPHWDKFLVPPCPSRIHVNKLLVPPPNLFLPLPQSRYLGAGPGSVYCSLL